MSTRLPPEPRAGYDYPTTAEVMRGGQQLAHGFEPLPPVEVMSGLESSNNEGALMDTMTETYPATPDSSLYLSCLDLAIRSFHDHQVDTSGLIYRANALFEALKERTS